jgi:hypothetical protein
MWSITGLPSIGINDLGTKSLNGLALVPLPPASSTTFMIHHELTGNGLYQFS